MKILLILCLVTLGSCSSEFSYENAYERLIPEIRKIAENAFFEGQRKAIENEFYVGYDDTNEVYYWIKSPWDNAEQAGIDQEYKEYFYLKSPIYQPKVSK